MYRFLVYLLIIPGDIISILIMFLLGSSFFNKRKFATYDLDDVHRPTFTLIAPAHNEGDVIERTIKSFINTDYPKNKKEMMIINDGSTDDTEAIVSKYARTIIDAKTEKVTINRKGRFNITLINKTTGGHGKSYASNEGGNRSKSDILFFIDADIELARDVFIQSAKHLNDPDVGAIGGYVIIRKNKSALSGFLRFESMMAQEVLRAGFNTLGVHYIIPGGCAVIKRNLWKSVGGYSSDSLAEDTDLTWKILTDTDKDIRFDPSIKVYADEPQTMSSLWNQRLRWSRGNLQVTLNHKHKVGRAEYGKGVTYIYAFWLASIMVPVAFVLASLGMAIAAFFNYGVQALYAMSMIVGISFYISWFTGVIVGKGKAALKGLISPGIPLLYIFTSSLLYDYGIESVAPYYNSHGYITYGAWMMLAWMFIAFVGTYFAIWLSKKPSLVLVRIAEFLQLYLFGYWLILVISVLEGYVMEAMGAERKWIRTVR